MGKDLSLTVLHMRSAGKKKNGEISCLGIDSECM